MVNYSNSIIYKLCCNNTDITDIYIGSTTNFRTRKNSHKHICNNENSKAHNLNVYNFIRANGGWSNWDMVQIEEYKAKDKHDLHARERHFIEELKPSLNKQIPTRSIQEWRYDNKEKIKHYRNDNQEAMKQYYENNKEQIDQYRKQYRNDHKIAISAKHKIKIECDCGAVCSRGNISRHRSSKQHKFYEQTYNFIYS